jgi:hypothetical protein
MLTEFQAKLETVPLDWQRINEYGVYDDYGKALLAIINKHMQSGYLIEPFINKFKAFFKVKNSYFEISEFDTEAQAIEGVNDYHHICIISGIKK